AEKACAIIDQILSVLEETHKRGIVHGALKPSNIFFDQQGLLRLTDFIIEGEVKSSIPQKIQENLTGAKYVSPEEIEGNPASARSDFYALGMVFYEMLSGKPILIEEGLKANLEKLKRRALLSKVDLSFLPPYLAEIIYKSLQADPLMRFSSAAEFRESIEKKGVIKKVKTNEELVHIFESSITQYGGEEIDKESEALENVGQVRLRWSKEKHRNWILTVILAVAVAMGILYAFLFAR
ncbi:MAG: serine/threonine protein kinase, partial [Candidatus Margulisiibacteriota bacterium]